MPTRRSGLHVAYVTSRFPFGAGETFLLAEARELADRVGSLAIVPMRPAGGLVHGDVQSVLAGTLSSPLLSSEIARAAAREIWRNPRRSLQAVASVLRSRTPAIFVKNLAVVPKALWLAGRLRALRVDHVHAHWGGASSTLAMIAAEAAGIPWSLTLHRWDIAENNLLERKLASAAFARTISDRGACDVRTLVPGAKVETIHMGVEVERAAVPRVPRSRPDVFRLIAVGHLVPLKGQELLLEAVAELRRRGRAVSLDIAGEGPRRRDLEERAGALGIADIVAFLGVVPHEELLARMHRGEWDAFVHSSVERSGLYEGIPVALMEAMSAALPVVTFSSGGVAELVRPGTGVVLRGRSAATLATVIESLQSDSELARQLGAAGRARIRLAFNAESVADELAERFLRSISGVQPATAR
jgi:glycosyltransferase involved in cell wall biosynthesis